MWWRQCVCCVMFLSLHQVSGKYDCHIRGQNMSCIALIEEGLHINMTASLSRENINTIEELKIVDSALYIIKQEMFTNFQNLQRLYLQSTLINYVEGSAFSYLTNLTTLSLTDNYIEKISTNAFPLNSILHTLDLSQNLLRDLSDFNIDAFPSLALLNISHNRLEYLPTNIVNKLKEENTFYLIIDNNPWNCAHPAWSEHLTTILAEAFCTNNNYNLRLVDEKLKKLESGTWYLINKDDNESDKESSTICSLKCAIQHCLLWMFGALWIGIILGNMCKIKRLLFTTPTRFEDKTTQCDKLELMSKL